MAKRNIPKLMHIQNNRTIAFSSDQEFYLTLYQSMLQILHEKGHLTQAQIYHALDKMQTGKDKG